MASECRGDLMGAQPIPAAGDHLDVGYPIGGRKHAMRERTDQALLLWIMGRARGEVIERGSPLSSPLRIF